MSVSVDGCFVCACMYMYVCVYVRVYVCVPCVFVYLDVVV